MINIKQWLSLTITRPTPLVWGFLKVAFRIGDIVSDAAVQLKPRKPRCSHSISVGRYQKQE
jgi:hypothetical protein